MNVLFGAWHAAIQHLWQTTLVLGVILVLDRALRNAPSRAIHALWSVALAKLLVPLSALGALSGAVYAALAPGSSAPMPRGVVYVLYPIEAPAGPAPGSAWAYAIVAATAVWASFVVYFLARIAVDAARALRLGSLPPAVLDAGAAGRLRSALAATGVPPESVAVCAELAMPTVAGFLRPRIVIPALLVEELSPEELRAILLHENTHRERRDPLRALVARIASAVFFFYPVVYPILRRLRATAELACDERVVSAGVSADAYARALARSLRIGLASPAFAPAAAGSVSLLRVRLERLSLCASGRYVMRFRHRLLVFAALALVALGALYPVHARIDAPKPAREAAKPAPPAAPVAAPAPVADSITSYPVPLKMDPPKYPEEARAKGVTGKVILSMTVTETGDAINIRVTGEPTPEMRALVESALEAARQWKFKPALSGARPVRTTIAVPLDFKLDTTDKDKHEAPKK